MQADQTVLSLRPGGGDGGNRALGSRLDSSALAASDLPTFRLHGGVSHAFSIKRMAEEGTSLPMSKEDNVESDEDVKIMESHRKKKKRQLLQKETDKAGKRGICYLSRVPPHMDPLKLRQILSRYGEIQRIYLTPEDPSAQVRRKKAGGFRGQEFSEGWVEFSDKHTAKRVSNMLNGEQIGGKKRSSFYYDIWNIKYLSKFKWDNLTEEIAFKNAEREQKLALELSAAKRERDFYMSKVDQSRALSSIDERLKKKQKVKNTVEQSGEEEKQERKMIRQFPQTKPLANDGEVKPSGLSRNVLTGIFGAKVLDYRTQ